MMPWRDQVSFGWWVLREWVLWPSVLPLWGQLVLKASQAVACVGVATGQLWDLVAASALACALGFATKGPWPRWRR
jgi:hypothetical protein